MTKIPFAPTKNLIKNPIIKFNSCRGTAIRIVILTFLSVTTLMQVHAQYLIPSGVKRIVFLGNSITYAGHYITFIETYLITRYPDRSFEIINLGLPSETVSGLSETGHAGGKFPRPDLHERLDRLLELTKPDLVFACFGINDGIYMPFDSLRFKKYKDGISLLHDKVTGAGAEIVLLTPPVYDDHQGNVKGYNKVLDKYSNWLLKQQNAQNWLVADIHFPMLKTLNMNRNIDSAFYFSRDGVHPGIPGHWLMAQQVLLFLGESEAADFENIDAALAKFPKGNEILDLVTKRQTITKNAWLTTIGHNRPGMTVGSPLDSAINVARKTEIVIRNLIK